MMRNDFQRVWAVCLTATLLVTQQSSAVVKPNQLAQLVTKPYLDLLETADTLALSPSDVDQFKRQLERDKQAESQRLEKEEKALKSQLDQERHKLSELNRRASKDTEEMTEERRKIHCSVLKQERVLREKNLARTHGIPVAFENKIAKLELLEHWPAKKREIAAAISAGTARQRKFGDIDDIGLRNIADGQEKDLKTGQDAIRELKAYGMMPPELEDKEVTAYVQRIADTIAANSDLKVPVKLTILRSQEINAFVLPGGYLFLNTGLIRKAASESELVGVMSHELAHAAARHGAKLMRRATIASLIYQGAQIAAMIFTGGIAGIGTYYALQYGFFGLGMALNLTLLGVNREFEAEADQLGVQYAWKAGYDPRGFVTFFDKMASEKGYVISTSFFRTHPPFFERIESTFSEIEYLPPKEALRVDSLEFSKFKQRFDDITKAADRNEKKKPRLKPLPECDDDEPLSNPPPST